MNDIERLTAARDRLCRMMGWEKTTSHKFEIIRQTMSGNAIALGVDKAEAIADRLAELEKELCDYKLAEIGGEFLAGMANERTRTS